MARAGSDERYGAGYAAGFAAGLAEGQKRRRAMREPDNTIRQEDSLIAEFLENKSTAFTADIIGFLGIADNKSNQIMLGHTMRRLKWIRRREGPPDRRWFYERATNPES